MSKEVLLNLTTILALIPITIYGFQKNIKNDWIYWLLLGVSVFGSISTLLIKSSGTWHTDLATSIWITIAVTMSLFAFLTIVLNEIWRLAPLVSGYMIFLSFMASILGTNAVGTVLKIDNPVPWIALHIIVSVTTYGFLTISAVAAFGAAIQESSLKAKIIKPIHQCLPSITDCDKLMVRLLIISEVVLAIGLISGMVLGHLNYNQLVPFNHKSILTVTTFIFIAILLITHSLVGIRGRKAARYVLCAYLLLTLGYLGVKFVSEIILN